MALETIIVAGFFAAVVGFIAYSINKLTARKAHEEYRRVTSVEFGKLTQTIYTQYGKDITEVIPESLDEDGNVVPERTEVRVVLEDKIVAAAITEFQASLYRQ
jgi:hypothetical protein